MNYLEMLIFFIFSFLVIMAIYVFIINKKRKVYQDGKNTNEIHYIVHRFNLDMRKVNYNKLKWTVTITNSFIVAFSATVVSVIDGIGWQMLIGFVMLILLIFSIYEIIGRIYARKGGKDNE